MNQLISAQRNVVQSVSLLDPSGLGGGLGLVAELTFVRINDLAAPPEPAHPLMRLRRTGDGVERFDLGKTRHVPSVRAVQRLGPKVALKT